MDLFRHPSGTLYTCKWCHYSTVEAIFENAKLCRECHKKALLAAQKPRACDICSKLFTDENIIRALFSDDGFSHRNEHGLWAASESGCGLCRLFLLQDPNPDERAFQLPLTLFADGDPPQENSGADIKSLYFSTWEDIFTLRLSVAALDDHAGKLTSQLPVQKSLGSENTIKKVRGWFNECLTSHTESLSSDGQTSIHRFPLPTRVVHVGTEAEPVAKLFQPPSIMYEDYITLSYCWGRQCFVTTLLSNIQAHFQGLEESKLPQTFKDAFEVTRKLGFRFIWIDALCIIQDSLEDKILEIGAMENIYSNSTLTIAVVNATSVTEGFLGTKPRVTVDIPYHSPGGAPGVIQVSPTQTVDLWEESLYTRAWCLQENLLSRRLLLFTDTEVLWQCQSSPMRRPNTTHVEYIADNPQLGFSPFWRIPASISSTVPQESGSGSDTELEQSRYTIWRNIVQNYTRRNLTVASDRLPAIAGVAQKFKDWWKDEYCAGIWKRHFIASLTWRRKSNVQRYWPPLADYRAPSWSWASIEGPIEFDSRLNQGNIRGLGAKLISVEIVPLRYQTPLGEVQNGNAVFEASLIRARDLPMRGLAGQDAESYRIGGMLTLDDHLEGYWPGVNNSHVLDDELKEHGWAMLLGEGQSGSGKMTRTTALILTPYKDNNFQRRGFWENSLKGASKWWVGPGKRKTITIV